MATGLSLSNERFGSEQKVLEALRPSLAEILDNGVEFPQMVHIAKRMFALLIEPVSRPVIMDGCTQKMGQEVDGINGFATPIAMRFLVSQMPTTGAMQPLACPAYVEAAFIKVENGCALERLFDFRTDWPQTLRRIRRKILNRATRKVGPKQVAE